MTRDEMLDKREDVLDEFDDRVDPSHGAMTLGEQRWFTAQLLADEIVRLREENETLHSRVLSGSLEDRSAIHQLQDLNLRHQEVNDRLRRILAALREPTDHIIVSAYDELCLQDHDNARYSLADTIRAAVAAAEKEVDGER